jgi:hypothetical protein
MNLGADEEAIALFRRSIEDNRTFPLGSRLNQVHQVITAAIATAAAKLEASLS